ncbi:MAG: hypothetical protein RL501_359 [Bacteroidota bacterium]
MSITQNRIEVLSLLGQEMSLMAAKLEDTSYLTDKSLGPLITQTTAKNGWFTADQIAFSLRHWGSLLQEKPLNDWVGSIAFQESTSTTVLIIAAGNIPLVGFHDILVTYLSGHKCVIKPASNDPILTPYFVHRLAELDPTCTERLYITQEIVGAFDAVIATGSDNSARYFNHYFGSKPNLIRRNRYSCAVLTGAETQEELALLGEDIFRYFGLGCRSVSKLWVPEGYDFSKFFHGIYPWADIINHHKYANNYEYNKAVYMMSTIPLWDNGFLLLKSDDRTSGSPIGTLNYQTYTSLEQVNRALRDQKDQLQCIVGPKDIPHSLGFGLTQRPLLHEYADGIDPINFVLSLY